MREDVDCPIIQGVGQTEDEEEDEEEEEAPVLPKVMKMGEASKDELTMKPEVAEVK